MALKWEDNERDSAATDDQHDCRGLILETCQIVIDRLGSEDFEYMVGSSERVENHNQKEEEKAPALEILSISIYCKVSLDVELQLSLIHVRPSPKAQENHGEQCEFWQIESHFAYLARLVHRVRQDQVKEKHICFCERVDESVIDQELPVVECLIWHIKEYQENKSLHNEEFDYSHILEPYLS